MAASENAASLLIGRPTSVRLVEECVAPLFSNGNKNTSALIAIATVISDVNEADPAPSELHPGGCVARVYRCEKVKDDSEVRYTLLVEGMARFKTIQYVQQLPFLKAEVQRLSEPAYDARDPEAEGLYASLRAATRDMLDLFRDIKLPSPVLSQMRKFLEESQPGHLADLLISFADMPVKDKLDVLDTLDLKPRMQKVTKLIKRQVQLLNVSQDVQATLESKLSKTQRELFLRRQLKSIQEELGEKTEPEEDELEELQKRLDEAQLPEDVEKTVQREFRRMKRMQPAQPEYSVIRNYLEWIVEMPWHLSTTDNVDISAARAQLEKDHYGLEKVKKRILEYLAVRKLKADLRGPILCFIGPPGVGKTSLGRSIADALDEIDKLGRDVRGDPASALLEVLDPEQNSNFTDHFLNVPVDLSKVLFIATANEADTIPQPLMDRMEVIRLSGYTYQEKLEIAKRHLLNKQLKAHGLTPAQVEFPDAILTKIAEHYTREAGVRNLEREIASVCRALAVEITDGGSDQGPGDLLPKIVTVDRLQDILGPEPFEEDISERTAVPGVSIGLAWTATGSGGLLFIEATRMPGTGQLTLTGMLGDVIKESAQTALSWVRSNAVELGLVPHSGSAISVLDKTDIHVHFPAGAIPKDGPSAGVTITTALVSLLANKRVRASTAMTGEVTLRGLVLPVGGIKEKVLAAHRNGIKRVIIPYNNRKNLVDVPAAVRKDIEFVYAKRIHDVLQAAFDSSWSAVLSLPESHL